MPTQQKPNRALTESSADQFYLIRQLNFQKLVLASQFLLARYFLRLARAVVPLYWHCLVVVAFDALFHQLDQVPGVLFSLFDSQEVGCGEEREAQPNESIIDHTKQSWYFSNVSSALTLDAKPNRSLTFIYTCMVYVTGACLRRGLIPSC
ncbi:Hypothetical_protein [Hexamita inflata]|uniref:Hypothetical_protein n=1 Tax=Hexamita inflata TaxID=28002 RepID=A0AA86TYA7_9EUKA|nr:Hypothetical protein HINF_LOCUS19277 [Hexamita inflata]